MCCYGVSSDTKNKNNKKLFISPFFGPLKKIMLRPKKLFFFLVYY